LPLAGQFFEHDVGDFDGGAIRGLEGIAGGDRARNVGNLDAGSRVLVAPLDADGIVHGDLLIRCEG